MSLKDADQALGRLQDSSSKLRELVNSPRRHHALLQRRRDFNLLCSAMDILDDTILALISYLSRDHDDKGLAYLEIFGVLQSLVVQQDSAMALHKILVGTPLDLASTSADAKAVREMRVRVAGHPAGGKAASHFLVRHTVSKSGFELWTYNKSGGRTAAYVDLLDLITINSGALHTALNEMVRFMENEDNEHKATFSDQKLADIFHTSTYCASKLFEGVSRRDPIGTVGSGCLRSIITEFKDALTSRGDHFSTSVSLSYDVPRLEHALNRYDQYLNADEPQDERDGYILARYIQVEIQRLADLAGEIDDEYATEKPASAENNDPTD